MQLPQDLQTFHVPTLIVMADFREARCYLADDQILRALHIINAPDPARPDTEGSVNIGGARYANPDSAVDEGGDRKHYMKECAHKLAEMVQTYQIQDVQLVMPSELLRRIQDEVPADVKDLVSKTLPKSLMKEDLLEVIARLKEIPVPVSK